MTLSRRLKLTVFFCFLLTLVIGLTLTEAHKYQQKIYHQLEHSMTIQLNIDSLRSQLWMYHESMDQNALTALQKHQNRLATTLSNNIDWSLQQRSILQNISHLNADISVLINDQSQPHSRLNDDARLLKSQFSQLIESMTQEMSRLHNTTIKQARNMQQMLLIFNGMVLCVLAVLVTVWSFISLKRFKRGFLIFSREMEEVAEGNLSRKTAHHVDDEFAILIQRFNHMKQSLNNITIKKQELKREVKRQTQELINQQHKLTFLAEHDELTGSLNRRAFIKQIDRAISRNLRTQDCAALLFIDLDKFKAINDNHGHKMGDCVIRTIANRLNLAVRNTDIVGRLGGDEFVIWLDIIKDRVDIEAKVSDILHAIKQPILINGYHFQVGASIGISQFPTDGNDSANLIMAADTAMYLVKEDPTIEFLHFRQRYLQPPCNAL